MIFVVFNGAGTQGVTLVSQRGRGVGTLHSSLTVPPCLFPHPRGDSIHSQFARSSLLLLRSEREEGWGRQLLHRIALFYMGNNPFEVSPSFRD